MKFYVFLMLDQFVSIFFLRLLFHCDDISIVIEIFALEFGIVDWGKTENLKVRSQSELAGLEL